MMFNKIVLVLLVTILGISWTQASVLHLFHKQQVNIPPPPGYYDEPSKEGEYLITEDSDVVYGRPDSKFRNKYEAQINKIYNYISGPQDQYLEIVTPLSYTFGHDPSPNPAKATLNIGLFKETLEKPDMRNKCTLLMIEIALKRITESCEALEDTLNPYLVNENLTALQNDSHLTTEDYRHEINVILLNVSSAKLLLLDLKKILDSFVLVSSTKHHQTFVKTVDGISLEELVSYTVSVLTSTRGSWLDWKLTSYYLNNTHNKS